MMMLKTVGCGVAVFVLLIVAVQATCPSTDQQLKLAIASCTTSVGTGYTAEETLAFCNNSAAGVIDCVQTLIDDCRAISDIRALAVLDAIDFENLKTSIETVCNGTDVIEANAACVDAQVETSAQCLGDELAEYNLRRALLRARLFQEGVEWYKSEVKKSICLYREALRGCTRHYLTHCGADVHSIFDAMFTAVSIPDCDVALRSLGQTTEGPYDNCPTTASETIAVANHCTAHFRSVTTFGTEIPQSDTILRYCQDSAERTTTCLAHLQTCAEQFPVVQKTLSSILNVDALKHFSTFACANQDAIRSKLSCVQPLEADANACALNERNQYFQKIRSAQEEGPQRGLAWFKETAVRVGCEYTHGLKTCTANYKLRCGLRFGLIYDSLFSAAGSPACSKILSPTTTTTTLQIPEGLLGDL